MAIRIHALGTVRVEHDGRILHRLPAQRLRLGLLIYLAVERDVARERVMGLFWPERPPERARHLLSQTLYELRQELGDDVVRTSGERLVVSEGVEIDVEAFAAAVEAGDHEAALALHGGRFLGGANLGASRELEGWIDAQEARIVRLHRRARRAAVQAAFEADDHARALEVARGWVDADPLDDEAQHQLIEILAAAGDRAGALRQYERYARLLDRELELEPMEETRELVERIREGEPRPQDDGPSDEGGQGPVGVDGAAGDPAAPLPEPPSRTVGIQPRTRPAAAAALMAALALVAGWLLLAGSDGAERDAELDPRRVAVLFFDDNSVEQDLRPVAAGFTEALIHELDQVSGLRILSSGAVEAYRRERPPLDSIVRALQAGTLVEGSLTRLADSIQVTFRLIDGATATHLLSGTLRRPEDEVTALVRELPREVARKLRLRLGTEIVLREARGGTDNAEAWLLAQGAQVLMEDEAAVFREDRPAGFALLERADSMLRRAERLDPDWPEPTLRRAQVARSRALRSSTIPGQYEPGATRAALGHLQRVLDRDPDHARALEFRGSLRFELAEAAQDLPEEEIRALYARAESDLRRAVELDVQRARAWWGLSRLLRRQGSFAEAKRAARRALAADAFLQVPSSGLFQLFHTSFEKEEHEEAVEWCDELRQRHPDSVRRVQCELFLLASSPVVAPDPDRGWALVDTMVAMGSTGAAEAYRGWATLYVAKTLARAGRPDSARAVLERTVPEPAPAWAVYDAAHTALLLGDRESALDYLADYVRINPGEAPSLANDWWFRPLHGDPRFLTVLMEAGRTDP